MKDSSFYNKESAFYSDKRYPTKASSYTQFFFKQRLSLTLQFLDHIIGYQKVRALLEVGCADGVIVRAVEATFPNVFSSIVGIDIAPEMIEEAKQKNTNPHAQFYDRQTYKANEQFDVVIETGVVNYTVFEDEINFAAKHLPPGGWFILSVAGTSSLRNLLKHESGFNDFRSYREYERLIKERFSVEKVLGVGFFVPYLWRVPGLARRLQTVFDGIVGSLVPGLCHEKLYLLRRM